MTSICDDLEKKKRRIFNTRELNQLHLLKPVSCRDEVWSLTSASGIVRLENKGVLVPHLFSSHTSKKRKHYLISRSPWLWYNSFKLPMRAHWTLCSAGPVFEPSHSWCCLCTAAVQVQLCCLESSCWTFMFHWPPDRWGRNVHPWVLCSWSDSSRVISPW